MNRRLANLKKLLVEAELDSEDNKLYIEDLKLSIEYENARIIPVYEAMKYD